MAFAREFWLGLGSWRDADVDLFVDQVIPRIQAGQVAVANLTDAYLSRVLELEPVGAVSVAAVRGVTPDAVYRRPATTMRTALSEGKSFQDALSASVARLDGIASTDLHLAYTQQARASMNRDGTHGFRRVLSGSENCALCMIASTQRYHKSELLPIHPGCDCGVEPLSAAENVGQVIDEDLLEQTHNWVEGKAGTSDRDARDLGQGTGRDYTQLIVSRTHGEYGPTLTWRGQHFDGPSAVS